MTSEDPILSVVVADDAALIRVGVVRLLDSSGFRVVGEAADYDDLIATVDATRPHLVVTDIRMPPTNTDEGLRAAAAIRTAHPSIAVLLLSQYIETRAATRLLDDPAGIGYLLKERVSALDEFLAAAGTVAAGGSVIDSIVADRLMRRRRDDSTLARLTDHERDVLQLMAQGKSNGPATDEALPAGAERASDLVLLVAGTGFEPATFGL